MPKKSYTSTGRSCRVQFELPADVNANTAFICGDFNEWNETSHPMKRRKDGSFYITLYLDSGNSYCYRFLLDGSRWENDWEAEEYAPNDFGVDDSVISV